MARFALGVHTRFYGMAAVAALLIVPAMVYRKARRDALVESSANFALSYNTPQGFVAVPHSPQSLFMYRNPKTQVSIRGAQNQIVADYNPTPELDRDGLTRQFADVTVDNLGWKAAILDTVSCHGGSYRIIRRETVDRTVVTGIAVRGNTTIMITLSGVGAAKQHVDASLPMFRDYLASTGLDKTIIN